VAELISLVVQRKPEHATQSRVRSCATADDGIARRAAWPARTAHAQRRYLGLYQVRGTQLSSAALAQAIVRRFASEGHELVAEFCDDGYSGARLDRPGLDGLRDAAEVRLYLSCVEMWNEGRCLARHERWYERHQQVLDLEHYLDVLERKLVP
jgi:hypothetical protein